jgi:Ca-activated chloride channel family protein
MSLWFERITGFYLQQPALLWLLLLIPLGCLLRRRRGAAPVRFGGFALMDGHAGQEARWPLSWRQRLRWLPQLAQIVGLALLVFALARPVLRTPMPLISEGIDIFIVLDTSSSMAEKDMAPEDRAETTRLDLAKEAATRFVLGRPQDRIGLITFARDPELACPPTLDHRSLTRILQAVELVEKDSAEDQTGIGGAVARAAELLRDSESAALILWTDGEENVAGAQSPEEIGPYQAAWLCERLGVRAYVVAAGRGRVGDAGRFEAIDTEQIEELALRSGGAFFAAKDADAAERIYRSIDQLERVEFREQSFVVREAYFGFVLLGAALLLLALLGRATVFEVLP